MNVLGVLGVLNVLNVLKDETNRVCDVLDLERVLNIATHIPGNPLYKMMRKEVEVIFM